MRVTSRKAFDITTAEYDLRTDVTDTFCSLQETDVRYPGGNFVSGSVFLNVQSGCHFGGDS